MLRWMRCQAGSTCCEVTRSPGCSTRRHRPCATWPSAQLLGAAEDDLDVVSARAAAVRADPIAITGKGKIRFYRSSLPGPGFRCGANDGEPCAWGATKAILALARIPPGRRTPPVARALDAGVAFLLGRDPADADYPMGYGNTKPNAPGSGSGSRRGT
jgi:hypothetical protein